MQCYKTKAKQLSGTSYKEVKKRTLRFYDEIKRKTKRKPYIRSVYFKKDKIFLDLFWAHLFQKNYWDQMRRMRLFPCAIELMRKSMIEPTSKENPNKPNEILHRFTGITGNKEIFFVQIKEEKRTHKKYLISIFPEEK